MLVELDDEHTKCGICCTKFSTDRNNEDENIRKHLPVLSSSQRCDHWFCHGCIVREQQRVAQENNGKIPKWLRCMYCKEKTAFCPEAPKYHRLLIDLLGRAQTYAATHQVKEEDNIQVGIKRKGETVDEAPTSIQVKEERAEAQGVEVRVKEEPKEEDYTGHIDESTTTKTEDAIEKPAWFVERVYVQLRNNTSGVIREVHGTKALVEMEDKSTESVQFQDISGKVDPKKHDNAIVITGRYVGKEGKIISIRGNFAMLKEKERAFVTVEYDALAKICHANNETKHPNILDGERTDYEKRKIAQVDNSGADGELEKKKGKIERVCSACKISKSLLEDFTKKQRKRGDEAKCKQCISPNTSCAMCKKSKKMLCDYSKEQQQVGGNVRACIDCMKIMEAAGDRQCYKCKSMKEKNEFKEVHWKNGISAVCESCLQPKVVMNVDSESINQEEKVPKEKEEEPHSNTGDNEDELPLWFMKDVCVRLKNNEEAIIKEVNGKNAVVELSDKSTQQVRRTEVNMIIPQLHEHVIVTGDSNYAGELVCVDRRQSREDAIVKGQLNEFRLFDFSLLAKVQVNESQIVVEDETKPVESDQLHPGNQVCSICRKSQPLEDFFRKQRRKVDGKCKRCLSPDKLCNMCQRNKKKYCDFPESNFMHEVDAGTCYDCVDMLEIVNERRCNRCNNKKEQDSFDESEQTRGLLAVCTDCLDKERDERRRKKLEEKQIREMELRCGKKREFEDLTSGLRLITIEEMMTIPSHLVYVVSSIRWDGEPFLPKCHGIFTTCSKAQAGAQKAFEAVSDSYRGGKFLQNDERIAKCDLTEFLIPGVEFASLTLFEEFEDHCAAVAINAIRIDKSCTKDLPFLDIGFDSSPKQVHSGLSEKYLEGAQVYAIFEFGPQTHVPGSYGNIRLCGVYREKDRAITRGKYFTDFESLEEHYESDDDDNWRYKERKEQIDGQLRGAQDVTNGLLFNGGEEDDPWAVALETVVLDQLTLNCAQLDFGHMEFHDNEDLAF